MPSSRLAYLVTFEKAPDVLDRVPGTTVPVMVGSIASNEIEVKPSWEIVAQLSGTTYSPRFSAGVSSRQMLICGKKP